MLPAPRDLDPHRVVGPEQGPLLGRLGHPPGVGVGDRERGQQFRPADAGVGDRAGGHLLAAGWVRLQLVLVEAGGPQPAVRTARPGHRLPPAVVLAQLEVHLRVEQDATGQGVAGRTSRAESIKLSCTVVRGIVIPQLGFPVAMSQTTRAS